ncbi:MAG: hypothetical protein FJ116_05930 [Deltaproteobacteria bacterium]|nr:hypothetical protein [Deltaproteobacteria bacterium]
MNFLRNQRGNEILTSVIAAAILGTTIVLIVRGYTSSSKFKNRVEHRASLSSVESGILSALTLASVYKLRATSSTPLSNASEFITALTNSTELHILGAGKLVKYNASQAVLLVGSSATAAATFCNNTAKAPKVPTASNQSAIYVFCLSGMNSDDASHKTFFGSDISFGLFKVSLKEINVNHFSFVTTSTRFGDFAVNTFPSKNYQAEINYSLFWGKAHDAVNSFEKTGYAIKDLR